MTPTFSFTCAAVVAVAAVTVSAIPLTGDIPLPSSPPSGPPTCVWTWYSEPGDTCNSLASRFFTSPWDIQNANTFLNCDDIWPNTPICMTGIRPAQTCWHYYTTKEGDTCASVTEEFWMDKGQLEYQNEISVPECANLPAGKSLCITTPPAPEVPCATTYITRDNENCAAVEFKLGLRRDYLKASNQWLNCWNVWNGTPVCVPESDSNCTGWEKVSETTTCAAVGARHGVNGEIIKYWNDFVNCDDIWAGTDVCVSHALIMAPPLPEPVPFTTA